MPVQPGTQFGPYEILSLIGTGGMGQVYKARDTRLDRAVAIKVLLDLPDKPELTQRFEREARAIAALNHPHICTLYDIGRHEGIDYLVMEYVDGETLAAHLARGPLPEEEAVRYGMQMADALDKAHRQGIIHRDLKPSNIMITAGGVKLLDFGLAKLRQAPDKPAPALLSALPTQDRELTLKGTILGTLQYMSPEQVEGKDADARTDVFALGVVLYEMVTGRKAFEGKSHVSLMAAILERDPAPISSIRPVSSSFDRIVRTCLQKDPDDRWQTAREVVRELKWTLEEKPAETTLPTPAPAKRSARTAWIVAAIAVAGLLAALVPASRHLLEPAKDVAVRRFAIDPPLMPGPAIVSLAISPDGRRLAFTAVGPDNKTPMLWMRPMDSLAAQVLPGTEQGIGPAWSPDSRFILFFANGKLKKIDLLGGLPQTLCDAQGFVTGTWSEDGVIVFANRDVLYRVPATGGQPAKLTELDASKQETAHLHPVFLPDNTHFLFTAWSRNPLNRAIYVGSIDTSERVRLVDAASMAAYSPPGFLLFQRDGTLMAEPFDATRRVIRGEAFPIAEDLSYLPVNGRSSFSVSRNGTLAYNTQNALSANGQLAWYDRTGKVLGMAGHPDAYLQVRLSPDEKRVAYDRGIGSIFQSDRHLWLLDLTSGIASPFTFGSDGEGQPVWSPDGRQVAFVKVKEGKGTIYLKNVGANQEELLFGSDGFRFLEDWARDGQTLIVRTTAPDPDAVFALPLTGERKATKLFESPFSKDEVQFSPDGRWVSFNSNDSGKMEVYVASFPAFTDRRQVSNAGGAQARWRKDGRELFYLGLDGKLMSVEIKTVPALESGIPKILFQTRIPVRPMADQYSPTADGQKFLLLEPLESASTRPTPITVVLDWTAALPAGK